MEDYLVSVAITVLLSVVKNPAKAAKIKKALLKVKAAIAAAFPGE